MPATGSSASTILTWAGLTHPGSLVVSRANLLLLHPSFYVGTKGLSLLTRIYLPFNSISCGRGRIIASVRRFISPLWTPCSLVCSPLLYSL